MQQQSLDSAPAVSPVSVGAFEAAFPADVFDEFSAASRCSSPPRRPVAETDVPTPVPKGGDSHSRGTAANWPRRPARSWNSDKKKGGCRMLSAPRTSVPGPRKWGAAIHQAHPRARVMVLIYTAVSNTSPQVPEIDAPWPGGWWCIPFRVEDGPQVAHAGVFQHHAPPIGSTRSPRRSAPSTTNGSRERRSARCFQNESGPPHKL